MTYVTFHWYACNCNGSETCLKKDFEQEWEFLRKVFGAYRYEIIHES